MQAVDLTTIQKFRTAIFEIFQNLTFRFNPKNYSLSDRVMYRATPMKALCDN